MMMPAALAGPMLRDTRPEFQRLRSRHALLNGPALLRALIGADGPLHRRTALVSAFGAESVVLLHMVAQIDPALPVIFLDTGRHFPETLAYRDQLVDRLSLRDIRTAYPDASLLRRHDRHGRLFTDDPDFCCELRKTLPLTEELAGFAAWITGQALPWWPAPNTGGHRAGKRDRAVQA